MCFNSISILCRSSIAYNVTALKEAPSTKRRAHERRNEKVVMTSTRKRVLIQVNATGLGGGGKIGLRVKRKKITRGLPTELGQ